MMMLSEVTTFGRDTAARLEHGSTTMKSAALAFSYLRFSSPEQAQGDSVRRQTALREDWLKRHPHVRLDTSLTPDEGVSAFTGSHRENPDRHALAAFLELVKKGRVPKGSYLLVENLDRLTREDIQPALMLFLGLLQAGVRVVQLSPVEQVFDERSDAMHIMMAIMELSRGHSESRVKSERVGQAWAEKRAAALRGEAQPAKKENRVNGRTFLTHRLPGWVKERDGKLVLIPQRAKIVRRIFTLALAGKGVHAIAKALNAEGAPVMGRQTFKGRPVLWNETVVYHVLISRATFGEYQPHKGRGSKRESIGDPISNYFPPVIDRDTFDAAKAALQSRAKHGSGRRGTHLNLFAGLLRDARDGGTLTYKHLANRASSIIPVGAKQGRGSKWSSFMAVPLERAIRSKLVEVAAADIEGNDDAARQMEALSGRVAELDRLIRVWTAKMDNPDIADTVAEKLAEYKRERKDADEKRDKLRLESNAHTAEAWSEFRTLAGLDPDDDTDERRVRIRAALRRAVESIHCLFTGTTRTRLAAVRVQFKSGKHRDYVIGYEPGRSNQRVKRVGGYWVCSFAEAGLPGEPDLRDPKQAAKLEPVLIEVSEELAQQLAESSRPAGAVTGRRRRKAS